MTGTLCNKSIPSGTPTDNQIMKFDSGLDEWALEAEGGTQTGAVPDLFARKFKTVDETIQADAVAHDDADIFFEADANSIFFWDLLFYVFSASIAGFQSQWDIPGDAIMDRTFNPGEVPGNPTDATVLRIEPTSNFQQFHRHSGRLKTITQGTIKWKWRQNVARGNTTTVGWGTELQVTKKT